MPRILTDEQLKMFPWCLKCTNSFTLNLPSKCPVCGEDLVDYDTFKKKVVVPFEKELKEYFKKESCVINENDYQNYLEYQKRLQREQFRKED